MSPQAVVPQGAMAPPQFQPMQTQQFQQMQMQQSQSMQAQMASMMMASMCMPMMYVPMASIQGQAGAAEGTAANAVAPAAGAATASGLAPPQVSEKLQKYQKLVKRKQKDNANVVFCGGLRKTTEEDRVCAHFAKFGQVEHVDIKRLADGTSRGFAFVKFSDTEAVDKVLEAHAKHMIDNKWIEVKRHDGMAACAGMTASLAKKVEEQNGDAPDEKEEPDANPENYEEQWSSQYLRMAQNLGEQQQMQQQQQIQDSAMKQQLEAMKQTGQPGMQFGVPIGAQPGAQMNPMMMMQPGMQMPSMMVPGAGMQSVGGVGMCMGMGMGNCMGMGMGMNPMMMQMNPSGLQPGVCAKSNAIGALPDRPAIADASPARSRSRSDSGSRSSGSRSGSRSQSRSRSNSKSKSRSRSQSQTKLPTDSARSPPPPPPEAAPGVAVPPSAPAAGSSHAPGHHGVVLADNASTVFSGTLSQMLHGGGPNDGSAQNAHAAQVTTQVAAQVAAHAAARSEADSEAAKAAARAAAAAVAATANQMAVLNRDAAKQAKAEKAKEKSKADKSRGSPKDADETAPAKVWLPDSSTTTLKPSMKLWLPEPSMPEPPGVEPLQRPHAPRPEPAPEARPRPQVSSPRRKSSSSSRSRSKSRSKTRGKSRSKTRGKSRSKGRSKSRSRRRKRSRSRSRSARPKKGGWDNEHTAPQPTPSIAPPSRPALPPGVSHVVPGAVPMGAAQVNRFGIPEASKESLFAAVLRAQQVEAAGLRQFRETGVISRGPPDLPTACEVIEQKCVAYLIGRGGQALGAIGAAAGVSIHIDQSTKTMGWSMANIYGTEEGAVRAKMILRQKISEYRPLRA